METDEERFARLERETAKLTTKHDQRHAHLKALVRCDGVVACDVLRLIKEAVDGSAAARDRLMKDHDNMIWALAGHQLMSFMREIGSDILQDAKQ
jgi:hypothetical protein